MDGADLRDLIAGARTGDRAAQSELFGRYRNYLLLLARMSLSRGLAAKLDASDVVQDVFVKAHQGFRGFRGATPQELGGWFRRILANRLADANRRGAGAPGRRIGREVSLEQMVERSSEALANFPAAQGTSPSNGAQRREVATMVADALAALEDDDREVIVLRSLEEREWNDVARHMDRTPEAARALWGRACQRLGAVLKEKRCSDR